MKNMADLLHALIDLVQFGSKDNADQAHAVVDDHFAGQSSPAGASRPAPDAPSGPEGGNGQ